MGRNISAVRFCLQNVWEGSMSELYGYVRISSVDQNEDRQMIELQKVGIAEDYIFVDKQSGKDFDRPQYQEMVKKIREGDYSMSFRLTGWGETMRRYRNSGGY